MDDEKILCLILMMMASSIFALPTDENDDPHSSTAADNVKQLCKLWWEQRTLKYKPAAACTKNLSINLMPNQEVYEVVRGPSEQKTTNDWMTKFEAGRYMNLGYLITIPENKVEHYDFVPKFTFKFKNPLNQYYEDHLIFKHPDNEDIGIIFEIKVGRGNTDWVPVTIQTQTVRGGYWHNTGKERWYYAGIRAYYVILPKALDKLNKESTLIIKPAGEVATAYFGGDSVYNNANIEEYGWGTVINMTNYLKLHQKVVTCERGALTPRSDIVRLKEVYKDQINPEIKGGTFSIDVKCNLYSNYDNGVLKYPKVFITFTGATKGVTNPNNGSDLLSIETGEGMASGIALKIKRQDNGETIKFGPESSAKGATGQFQLPQNSEGNSFDNGFDVYYAKNNQGEIKAGKVKAKATFTFSYQ